MWFKPMQCDIIQDNGIQYNSRQSDSIKMYHITIAA